ncbi:hypothetical protein K457DRAFT_143559 [Linnemannia elongata AG-77]|uniref:Uncharacterized protein n=1 Tax=Linnemannia elongata AG-77 TaxID=1314771 RepID=A0A197JBL9_9FUNG|nr:hypothetical protein K457DRAFT_143559 [Linnemannia elongata AG-77]
MGSATSKSPLNPVATLDSNLAEGCCSSLWDPVHFFDRIAPKESSDHEFLSLAADRDYAAS